VSGVVHSFPSLSLTQILYLSRYIQIAAAFRTPEEAQAFLKEVQTAKKKQEKPAPPTHLNSSDLNDWYSQQRQFDLNERKKRIEAETLLRGYRGSKLDSFESQSGAVPSSPKRKSNGIVVEGSIVEEGIDHVLDQVGKLEREVNVLNVDKDNEHSGDRGEEELEDGAYISASSDEEMIGDEQEFSDVPKGEIPEEAEKDVSEVVEGDKDESDAVEEIPDEEVEDDSAEDSTKVETEEPVANDDAVAESESEEIASVAEEEAINIEEEKIEEDVKPINSDQEPVEEPADEEEIQEDSSVADAGPPPVAADAIKKDDVCSEEEKKDDGHGIEGNATAAVNPETGEDGWRFLISREPGAKFPPEANRYHLYVAYACPWAHRTVIVRNLKGLKNVIGVTYVHPTWQFTQPGVDDHRGWVFGSSNGEALSNTAEIGNFPSNWGEEDPNMGAKTIRDVYEKAKDETGKYILPVLWDKQLETIVSNESSEIIRMLNEEFNEFAENADLDLYPEKFRVEIDELNSWVYPKFNNGVYRCGLASTQESYDDAIDDLTLSFDKIDSILQKQRFLAGDTFTEADVRLFVTLIRFDEVYDVYFKCNTRSVAGTPSMLNYVREIYQMSGVTDSCQMDMIKAHYYTSHVELNKYSIIPRGENFLGLLKQPHSRDVL